MHPDSNGSYKSRGSWLTREVFVVFQRHVGQLGGAATDDNVLSFRTEGAERASLSLRYRAGAGTRPAIQHDEEVGIIDWQRLLREELAPLDAATREQITSFLSGALKAEGARNPELGTLCKRLNTARDALRERLPAVAASEDSSQGLAVDTLLALDGRSFYARGWFRDEDSEVTRLTAVSPEGARVEILDGCFRYVRADVRSVFGRGVVDDQDGRFGFVRLIELPVDSRLPSGWVFEMESASGEALEVHAAARITDFESVRDALLGDLTLDTSPSRGLLASHLHPALAKLQAQRHAQVRLQSVEQFGSVPREPGTTVIVPLYGRTDFLEHQLAQFVHDPEFLGDVDLLYVLDSPELAEALLSQAFRLSRLYPMPFRIAILNRNGGYSSANNIGASLARGRQLLLLNSDVLPSAPGWVREMTSFHGSIPGIGALGPKLLFEDESIQHAGLYFSPMPDGFGWENLHYFKGLQRDLPSANVARPVPAVSAACLLIDRELYETVGGLRGDYIQGDYEDSDLCLRLLAAGKENWYLPEVELFHLEGQSYPSPMRRLTSRYNRWLHTMNWSAEIPEAMQRYAGQ